MEEVVIEQTTKKTPRYLKTDHNEIVKEKYIRWVKKIGDCLEVCTKASGCNGDYYGDTHKICKLNNVESYNALHKYF
jgi:hypothetical protein